MTQQTRQDELIQDGQPLVHSLATQIYRNLPVRADLNDLIAYGEVGLAEAARDFDPEKGARFTTFAYYRVRGAIYDGISKMSWTSRVRYRRYRYQQMSNEVLAENADEAESGEATSLETDAAWLRNTTEKLAVVYLASQQGSEDDASDNDVFEDRTAPAATIVANREVGQRLHEAVDALPNQTAQLIRTIYFEGATLQEAATRLGISKSWASKLHARTLQQLAASLRKLGAAD